MFLMTAIFFLSWFGQSVNGWRTFNNTRDEHKSVHISPLFASGVPGESCTGDGSRAPTKGKPDAGDSRLRDRVPTLRVTVCHVPNSVPQSPALLFADPARL
jgi:hypothetical protein